MKKITSLLLAACIVLLLFASCFGGASGKEITVVFIPKLKGDPFFEAANGGAQEYGEKHGFNVSYEGSGEASVEDQIQIIRDAIERKVDAICVSSLDANALNSILKEAISQGIKVTTWDSDVSGDARMIMVSQGTPEQLGTMLVEMGAKSLANRGLDPSREKINYVWHYSQKTVSDQNSWQMAGEEYIKANYPNWINANSDNYYSMQNPEKALQLGKEIFSNHSDIDLVICPDSTALPAQAEAAKELGLRAKDITITGFATPNSMREYCKDGIVERWGLWDCRTQGALGCYIAYYLALGNQLKVGSKLDVPDIGLVSVMPNSVLSADAFTSLTSGVVLLPDRTEFTIKNIDDFNF